MSVDVTNTQSGGIEPEINPNDYKANITPPKEATQPVAQETQVATPIAEEVVKPTQEEAPTPPALPLSTPELDNEIKEPKKSLAEDVIEDDNLHEVELPDPIDTSNVNAFDFSLFETPINQPANTELEEAPKPIFEDTNVEPTDEMDAFGSLDLIPNFEKQPHEIEVFVPELSVEPLKKVETTKTIPTTAPIVPATPKVEAKQIKTRNGDVITSKFKDGKPEGATNIQYANGTGYSGNIKNNKADGIGTSTVNGKKVTGAYKDGKLVAVLTNEPNENETPESVDVKKPFESIKPTIKKQDLDVAGKMVAVKHEDVSNILASSGIDADSERNEKILNVKQDIKEIYSILNSGKYREGKQELSIAQKNKLEKILNPLGKPSLIGVVPNAGQGTKSTKQLIREIDLHSKQLHKNLEELQTKPQTNSEKFSNEIKVTGNKLKARAKNLDAQHGGVIGNTINYITSPEHQKFIERELTTGDKKVSEVRLQQYKDKAYIAYLKHNPDMQKGHISRAHFEKVYGKDIDALHLKVIDATAEKLYKSKNKYGYEKLQEVTQTTNKQIAEAKSLAINSAYNETAPYYLKKKNDETAIIKKQYEDKSKSIEEKYSGVYRTTLQSIAASNPEIKSIYDDYQQRINQADTKEDAIKLSKELSSKLNSFPKVAELNEEYQKNIREENDRNIYETNVKLLRLSGRLKNEFVRDIQKTANPNIRKEFRKTGYMAQYNALGRAEQIGKSKEFNSADYQGKKKIIEQGWNDHVSEVQNFFKGKMIRTPKDENERLNKHFTEWTGELKPKTAKDLEIKQRLLGSIAHDKYRTFAMYDTLQDDTPNTTQYKAQLEDRLSFVNDQLERLGDQSGIHSPRHDEYLKLKQQQRNITNGLNIEENDQNSLGSFLDGLTKSDIPFISSIFKINSNNNLIDAIERYERGESSSADVGLLMTNNIKGTIQQLNPESIATKVGTGTGNMVSFMAEMWATGGASSLGYNATKAVISSASKTAIVTAGITNATTKNIILKAVTNPETISFLGRIAEYTMPRVVGMTARVGLMPSTYAGTLDKQIESHYSNVVLAHSGALDEQIANMTKGNEGLWESTLKGIGYSYASIGAELLGAPIAKALVNPIEKALVNYMASNKFFQRSVVGSYMRKKAFTVDQFENVIDIARREGKMEGFFSENIENYLEQGMTNLINGDPLKTGFDYESQGEMGLTTAVATGLMGGLSKGYNKFVIRRNDIATNIISGEGDDLQTTVVPTSIWNQFNLYSGKKEFTPPMFAAWVDKHDLNTEQKDVFTNIYTKLNPKFKDNGFLNDFTQKVNEEIGEDSNIQPEDIAKGDVTLIDETTPEEVVAEEVVDDRTEREIEEANAQDTELSDWAKQEFLGDTEQTQETNDTENQTGLPSEVGTTEEPIQAEPIQETGSQETETSGILETPSEQVDDIERRRKEEINSEKSFEGNRTQADLLRLPDNFLTKGEYVQINNVNISQDTTFPDYRTGKYKVQMISIDVDGKDGIVTFSDGNEVITPKISDLINAKYDAEIEALKTNESTTPTNTPTDGNIQPPTESSTQTGQGEAVQSTTEPTASEGNAQVERKVVEPLKTNQDLDKRKMNRIINSLDEATKKQHFPTELPKDITPKQFATRLATAVGVAKANELMGNSKPTPKVVEKPVVKEPVVKEKKTVLSKSSDFEENKKAEKVKKKVEQPAIYETENNPFHEIKEKGKKILHTREFRNKYGSEFGNIKEINDNFEDIVSQLKDEVEIRNC